ncbi:MAG TPA: caspase family protein [Cyclobacteriaceae bacterium]|nr:caspase family protein [Cyclobacteriaceae bacterium]
MRISHAQTLQTVIQRGHDQAVLSVACSPDSNYVATGSRDRSAKLWELNTGREVRSFFGHEGSINCIDFGSDGKLIITSSGDRTAKIWDVSTGREIFSTPREEKILTAAAFSPDMKYFVTAGYPDKAKVWDFKTKKVIATIDVNADQGLGYGINLAFSNNGEWLAIGEDNRVANVYKTSTWEKVYTFTYEEGWCGGCATWVSFSHDNRSLVMASNKGPVKKYDLVDGKLAVRYADDVEEITSLLVSRDDKNVSVTTKKSIITWDLLSGNQLGEDTIVNDTEINEAKITLDGSVLLAADDNEGKIWDGALKRSIGILTGILNQRDKGGVEYDPNSYWESHIAKYLRLKNEILLSPDGKSLLKGKFGAKMKRWDIATGRTLVDYEGHEKAPVCYVLSHDGTKLLTGGADGKVIVWDAATGDTLRIIKAHREPVFSVQFSHDEKRIMSSSWDATLKIFDTDSGQQLEYFDFENASVYNALFSQNDLYIFAAQLDQSLKMYEADTRKVVREFIGHSDIVSAISLDADGKRLLSASWDGSIRLWNIATGLMEKKFIGHKGAVDAARFSRDERFIFSGGADRTIRIWDVDSGTMVRTLEGHQAEVTSIVQSQDGTMLISHSTDGATKFWDLKTGLEFFEHIHIGKNDWLVRNTDGYFSGTDDARKSIHFVNGMKTYSVDQFFNEFYRPELLPQIFKTRGSDAPGGTIQGELDTSPPPLVKIASLETSDPTKIELYVKITNQGGGVNNLKLFHNNKNIPIHREALKLPAQKGEHTVYKQVVELVGGMNTFSVVATNQNHIESDPASIEYFSDHASKSSVCYILAVGINEYKNPKMTLNYAKPDAQALAEVLEQRTAALYKSVELTTLYDRDASSEKILHALDEVSQQIHPEDVFIFYYAGHGSMVDGRFFFIPTESIRLYDLKSLQKEALEASVLQEKLRHISALKQLIIMDACQSGGSVEVLGTRGANEEKAIAQLSRSAGIHVMASAGSEQFATEFASLGHGLFTYLLIKALEGEADGAPKDGKVTIYELKSYMDDQVPETTRRMKGKPQYPYTFSRGQDFPVVLRRDE